MFPETYSRRCLLQTLYAKNTMNITKVKRYLKIVAAIIVLLMLLIKIFYKIGGENYLQKNKNTDIAKDISAFIIQDIPGLQYQSNIINKDTTTINLTLVGSEELLDAQARKMVVERGCIIIENNQPQIKSLNINIYSSRSQAIMYTRLLHASKCI